MSSKKEADLKLKKEKAKLILFSDKFDIIRLKVYDIIFVVLIAKFLTGTVIFK